MPLPLSGTAEVEAGEDIVVWIGSALTPLNCVPGATIALDGRTYFVKERLGTDQLRLTREFAEEDGTVPAEIEQLSPEQVATATLNRRAAQVMSELSTLDANGRGLFYNLIGVTGDNDPGPGNLAFNQTDLQDVTEIYLDVLDANDGGRDVSGIIDLWPMNTVLIVRSLSSNAYGAWRLLGAAIEAGYRRLEVAFVSRDGEFGAEPVAIEWRLSGADRDVDAEVDTPEDLVDHDDAEPPFRVLVRDYDGEGRAARVSKLSGDAGAWSGPAWWTGSKGDKGDTGPRGVTPKGAYSGAAAYVEGDAVRDNGSTWVALQPTTGNAPPVYPTTSNAYWELLAVKGQDGAGTGDVVGPSSATNLRIAVWDGPTGKLLKDGGKTIAEIQPEGVVRFDDVQVLSAAQKGQAIANIGMDVLGGFRNKIINGDFNVWQRGLSQTSSGYGSVDRWSNLNAGSTKVVAKLVPLPGQLPFGASILRTTVTSVSGANNLVNTTHRIEDVRTLAGKKVTLTFWARGFSGADWMALDLYQYFGTGGTPSATVDAIGAIKVPLTNAFQKFSFVIDIPSISGKTLGTNEDHCLAVRLWFDAGSGYNSATQSLGQRSGIFDITHVSLVEGDAAAEADPFSPRHPQQELALCQRYFELLHPQNQLACVYSSGVAFVAVRTFAAQKRATPSFVYTIGAATALGTVSLASVQGSVSSVAAIINATAPVGTAGAVHTIITADAEL